MGNDGRFIIILRTSCCFFYFEENFFFPDGNLSNILKKTSLRTVELRSCQADYLKEGPQLKNRISDSQYCAADPNGIRDACQGMQHTVKHYN